jgi:hypothetical protein
MTIQLTLFDEPSVPKGRKKGLPMAEESPTTIEKKESPKPKKGRETATAKILSTSKPKKKGGRSGPTKRLFPALTLEESLKVPMAVKINGGNPFDTKEVAKACEMGPKNPNFFYLTASSKAYGLTEGSSNTAEISLTDLGRGFVYPESPESRQVHLANAFFNVPVFKDVYEHYKGALIPEMAYLESKLLKLNIPNKDHESFADIYKKNYDYLKLAKGLETLQKEKLPTGETLSVVGQVPGTYQHHAFIIMPFSEKGSNPRPKGYFSEMLQSLLTPACNSLNFRVTTANVAGSDLIHHTIMKNLLDADLVVADLTDHNPNVAFKLGVRIALDKPVCIIRAIGMGPFFDVDNLMRVYEYDPCLWTSSIARDLPKLTEHIRSSWENKGLPSYMQILTNNPQAINAASAIPPDAK